METYVNGRLFKALLINGLNNLEIYRDEVNDLNVFPVPDGDTGTNMCMTLTNGINALKDLDDDSLAGMVKPFSKSVVLGARGNSGVILSQFLKGVCEYLSDFAYAGCLQLCSSFALGVKTAYKAVLNPTEGTMLTVLREASDYLKRQLSSGIKTTLKETFSMFVDEAKRSLAKTPELLDVLKKADVIDSGGQGIVYIFEGMYKYLCGESIGEAAARSFTQTTKNYDYSLIGGDTKFIYGYCTEVLVQIKSGVKFDENAFTEKLSRLGGSIVVSVTDDKFKIHIHTFTPEKVLSLCHECGEFLALKIENMDVQNINERAEKRRHVSRERVALASVAVAPDKKLAKIFTDMGASAIVTGGDTCNPSVEDFINAFRTVNADEILVFPNSSNVVLTARQAAESYTASAVTVADCTSFTQCYSTLALVDYAATADENASVVQSTAQNVATLVVFKAVKNSVFDGKTIEEGDFVVVEGKKLLACGTDVVDTVITAVKEYEGVDEKEVVTLFAGKSANAENTEKIVGKLREVLPFADVYTILTDNPVHEYLISLE